MPRTMLGYLFTLALSFLFPLLFSLPAESLELPLPRQARQSSAVTTPTSNIPDTQVAPSPGVSVEKIWEGSALEDAGLQENDTLLSWELLSGYPADLAFRGQLESPFDLMWLATEQAPRGTLRLSGTRGQTLQIFTVRPGWWGIDVRPNISLGKLSTLLRERLAKLEKRPLVSNEPYPIPEVSSSATMEAWLHWQIGKTLAAEGNQEGAAAAYEAALMRSRSSFTKITVLLAMGNMRLASGDLPHAENAYKAALTLAEKDNSQSLITAQIYHHLGELALRVGDLNLAQMNWATSLKIRELIAPGGLDAASSLNNLANIKSSRGDLTAARLLHEQALEIRKRLAPKSPLMAASLVNLGYLLSLSGQREEAEIFMLQSLQIANTGPAVVPALRTLGSLAADRGNHKIAIDFFERAKALETTRNTGSLEMAKILGSIGILAAQSGDYNKAIEHLQQTLRIQRLLSYTGIDKAKTLRQLGTLMMEQGDLESAADFFSQSLTIWKRHAPLSLEMANELTALGRLNRRKGDINLAESYYQQALQIERKLTPKSPSIAATLINLGGIAGEKRQFDMAERFLLEALEQSNLAGLSGLVKAACLHNFGILRREMGNFEASLNFHTDALEIRSRLAPGSLAETLTLSAIADTLELMSRSKEAIVYRQRSVEALELQIGRMSVTEDSKAGLRADHRSVYLKALSLLLEHEQADLAFDILERYRARGFLNMLAERDLLFSTDLPTHLRKRLSEAMTRHGHIRNQIAALDEHNERAAGLLEELSSVRREYDEALAVIRRTGPRLAGLKYPVPLTSHEVTRNLEPGTVIISFAVGTKQVYAFASLAGEPIRSIKIAVTQEDLRHQVSKLRDLMGGYYEVPLAHRSIRVAQAHMIAKDLFETLLRPFFPEIEQGERLLIIPDGPLHLLPWGMLVMEGDVSTMDRRSWRYLAEWRAIFTSLSVSAYLEMKKLPRASMPTPRSGAAQALSFVGFGSPQYAQTTRNFDLERIEDVRIRSAIRRGFRFEDLPFSRGEVERILRLFPSNAKAYLGAEATEAKAKSLPRNTHIVHFATHAILDEHSPLDSAVVLSIPEKIEEGMDNGFLQAWEIFEGVRIDADLVVLSTCESALGQELGGEGLIGLTRAFQYSGARSVLASLWKISDRATVELMVRFYKHLLAGLSKDEALRQAQIELIRGPIEVVNERGEKTLLDATAPYFWAGFQLHGDWQ